MIKAFVSFLQIIICKNWGISYKSLLLIQSNLVTGSLFDTCGTSQNQLTTSTEVPLYLIQNRSDRVQQSWATCKLQPGLNPEHLTYPISEAVGPRVPPNTMTSGPRCVQTPLATLLPNHTRQLGRPSNSRVPPRWDSNRFAFIGTFIPQHCIPFRFFFSW